ncbi:hypothetical protein [Gordonia hankookensis]|uniref:Uncharacterized protein n=1 Tax=Gordonia hankookensis TaxID=589403 RepID=A0ABR7WCV5_9ACTN|nr:hypothetical protein [Gordonia hankookensis]MBD1320630.1 hypothetical protein [Gordonia hankookensis]NDZ92808.1 hypothetical protein [Streptomyces sp. SID11726]NEB26623.1 hypothetical protein [Streptomyces sp. SID6673]
MSRVRVPGRSPLWIVGAVVVVVVIVVLVLHGRSTLEDREQRKTESTAKCLDVIRADVRDRLAEAGSGTAASQSAAAGFSDVTTRTTSVGRDDESALRDAGRERSSVATEWAVRGSVSVPGDLPGAARLGPTNTFVCNAVVLTDDSVLVTHRTIN